MSKDTIFVEYADKVFSRYKKTTVGAVAGIRLNPRDGTRMPFILMSDFKNFDPETNTLTFNYDTDVIEIYSEQEDRVFLALNRYLFQNGLIAPYDGTRDSVDMSNALSDAEISDIAGSKNLLNFKKRIKAIDSVTTLQRIKDTTERADRPISFIRAIEERIKELS